MLVFLNAFFLNVGRWRFERGIEPFCARGLSCYTCFYSVIVQRWKNIINWIQEKVSIATLWVKHFAFCLLHRDHFCVRPFAVNGR